MSKKNSVYLSVVGVFVIVASLLVYFVFNFSYVPSEVAKSINYNLDIVNQNSKQNKEIFQAFESALSDPNKPESSLTDLLNILQSTKEKLIQLEEQTKTAKSNLTDGYNQDTKDLSNLAREILSSRASLLQSLSSQITVQSCTLQRTGEFTNNFELAEKSLSAASSKATTLDIVKEVQTAIEKINNGNQNLSQIKLCYTEKLVESWTQDMQADLDSDTNSYNNLSQSLSQLIQGLEKSDTKLIDQASSQIAVTTAYKTKLFENPNFKNFIQGLENQIASTTANVESQEKNFNQKYKDIAKKYRLEIK